VIALVCAGVAAAAAPAEAHQSSVTHSRVVVAATQEAVEYRILLSPADLVEALPAGAPAEPDDATILAAAPALGAYVTERIELLDGDTPCPAVDPAVRVVDEGGRFVEVRFTARCPRPITTLVIEYQLFFDLDPLHAAMLRVEHRGDEADDMLQADRSRFVWELGEPPPSGLVGFLASGVDHIFYGFDHIAFLLGLLLLVVIAPPVAGTGAAWELRGVKSAFLQTATIVTAFTVAHSLTLIAAVLGWIRLPDRLVEITIAASIVFVAVQNVLWPHARQRWLLGFGFGLIHGLGFARMLAVQLPDDRVVTPLLAFNGGVELGQLAIVLVALPVLHLAARYLGGARYRAAFLPAASAILALLGLLWLIERAAEVTILGL
jgi:hypothetical protein